MDALLPREIATKAEEIGVAKATLGLLPAFLLSLLAGAFIALGGAFYLVALAESGSRLVGGAAFSLGLVLVVLAGAELFTGNNLVAMAWAAGRVPTRALARSWGLSYLGNLLGAVATALLLEAAGHGRLVGKLLLAAADAKCGLHPLEAVAKGILCNALVCLAVWLTYGARSSADKILCILFPITAFVACGFEHCVANMYFLPAAMLRGSGITAADALLRNLLPVTAGNVAGGTFLVALVYWTVYLRRPRGGRDQPR